MEGAGNKKKIHGKVKFLYRYPSHVMRRRKKLRTTLRSSLVFGGMMEIVIRVIMAVMIIKFVFLDIIMV